LNGRGELIMSNTQPGPAFLSELADDVVLTASILPKATRGAERAREVIMNLGAMYASRTVAVMGVVGNKTFIQYDATLVSGEQINAVTVLTRNDSNLVVEINVGYSPLQAVEALTKNFATAFGQ